MPDPLAPSPSCAGPSPEFVRGQARRAAEARRRDAAHAATNAAIRAGTRVPVALACLLYGVAGIFEARGLVDLLLIPFVIALGGLTAFVVLGLPALIVGMVVGRLLARFQRSDSERRLEVQGALFGAVMGAFPALPFVQTDADAVALAAGVAGFLAWGAGCGIMAARAVAEQGRKRDPREWPVDLRRE